jgi:hypothetical protein
MMTLINSYFQLSKSKLLKKMNGHDYRSKLVPKYIIRGMGTHLCLESISIAEVCPRSGWLCNIGGHHFITGRHIDGRKDFKKAGIS